MKILFLTSTHDNLNQRLMIELTERGHKVAVSLAANDQAMLKAVDESAPDLIIAPMLKAAVPEAVYSRHTCLIVHPGPDGDAESSLPGWAITDGEQTWEVTEHKADAGWAAGPIWALPEIPDPASTVVNSPLANSTIVNSPIARRRLHHQDLAGTAVGRVVEAAEKLPSPPPESTPPDDGRPEGKRTSAAATGPADRVLDWKMDTTDAIVAKINAGGSKGVIDTLFGAAFYLYGACHEDRLRGTPGQPIAQRDGAVCVATVDGAVWISHLKTQDQAPPGHNAETCRLPEIRLPATVALGRQAAGLPASPLPVDHPADYRTFREIRYIEKQGVGRLFFDFHNGAMSTDQCRRLRDAFLFARSQPTRVIELRGGAAFFSNGIHLNVIEAAADPALESWHNINAIDDLVLEILNTMSHLVVAGLSGNAGAGGAMLALAADYVYAREGVVLNPHYKGMGLYGSEYWTYTLPRRVGAAPAIAITEGCRPMTTDEAKAVGFIDDCFGGSAADFGSILVQKSEQLSHCSRFWHRLREKHERRIADEQAKPLARYRAEELARMRENFYGPDQSYHAARQRFVYKGQLVRRPATPEIGPAWSPTRHDMGASERSRMQMLRGGGR